MARISNWVKRFNKGTKHPEAKLKSCGMTFEQLGGVPQSATLTFTRNGLTMELELEPDEIARVAWNVNEILQRRGEKARP